MRIFDHTLVFISGALFLIWFIVSGGVGLLALHACMTMSKVKRPPAEDDDKPHERAVNEVLSLN